MNLSDYLSQQRGRHAALAKAIGVHAPDISRWLNGTRPIPVAYGAAIEAATGGLVTRREMFPNDWPSIWPELAVCGEGYGRRKDDATGTADVKGDQAIDDSQALPAPQAQGQDAGGACHG